MSRTWKDRPYRAMQAEATHAGCLKMRPYYHPFDNPLTLEPDVVAYAYAADHNTHIPAQRFTLCRFVERSWTTDYGTRRQVREALRDAANQANSGHDMRDWDNPMAYQRRRRWIDAS